MVAPATLPSARATAATICLSSSI